ncbi:TPA: hypothetical protein DCY43_01150 [candidate division WWE3 bacterium]|uniref:Uncharacterized protein n=2 Tax=Katanobacteria TaxID=422282 RepID=A0A1F4V210_UNCKA|nr:MAG: hypothetical protein A2709_01870 [candidate division WWE3 bacterium RIFCSPHIGHO2_01_FULL_43_9]HAZ29349.1 hypothetical protein [candidate division WWE3 bacterium]
MLVVFLSILLVIYLTIGLVYAVWILLFGYDRWYWFPINWLAGPPVIVMMIYFVVTGKKNPLGR